MVFLFLCFLVSGCIGTSSDEPVWRDIKIGDLAPQHEGKGPGEKALKTINLSVNIFEMPAENAGKLNDIWQVLYSQPVRFKDYKAFEANSFALGFGQGQIWYKVAGLLGKAESKKIQTISLLLPDGGTNDIPIAGLYREQSIFYMSADGSTQESTSGPGRLVLRIRAKRVPGMRGLYDFGAEPILAPPGISPVPELAERARSSEFPFSCAAFRVKMEPGDFFLLGPGQGGQEKTNLAGYFFYRPSPGTKIFLIHPYGDRDNAQPYFGPVVRIYLFVCTGISN